MFKSESWNVFFWVAMKSRAISTSFCTYNNVWQFDKVKKDGGLGNKEIDRNMGYLSFFIFTAMA